MVDSDCKINRINRYLILFAIIFAGILIRCYLLSIDITQTRDACYYFAIIDRWYESGKYIIDDITPFWIPPLYFLTAKMLMSLGISAETAAIAVSFASGIMLISAVYFLATAVCKSSNTGLLAALFAAVHPGLAEASVSGLRESLFLLLFVCSLLCLCQIWRHPESVWPSILSGIVCGMAFMTRYEAVDIIICFGVLSVYLLWAEKVKIKQILLKNFLFYTFMFSTLAIVFFATGSQNSLHSKTLSAFFTTRFSNMEE